MSNGTVGNTAWTQQGWDEPGSGFAAASLWTMPEDGWITVLHGYFDGVVASQKGWLCVWDGSSGALLASYGSFTLLTGTASAGGQDAWSGTLATPLFVPAGQTLWIGFYTKSGLVWSSGTGGTSKICSMGSNGPTTFVPATSPIGVCEAYAEYSTGSAQKRVAGNWTFGPAEVKRSGTQTKGLSYVMRNGSWVQGPTG